MPTRFQATLGQRTRACVPHTPYTSVLKFVPSAGRVRGAATHAVGRDAGYGLLRLIVPTGYLKMPYNEKATYTFGGAKCRLLFFWECMVGIHAYAGAGCLGVESACVRTAHTLHLGFKVYAAHSWSVWRSHARG